jgi:hypothetical protein
MASPEPLIAGQPAVGLDGERDDDRQAVASGGADDAGRLLGARDRHRVHHVRGGAGERGDLLLVVGGRLVGRDGGLRAVAVVQRPDDAADHDGRRRGELVAHLLHERNGRAVGLRELRVVDAELARPARARPPGRRLEHEADAVLGGGAREALVVAAQPVGAGRAVEQRERRERRQVDAVVEDQLGLQAGVGQEDAAVELGQVAAVSGAGLGSGHAATLSGRRARRYG